MHLVDQSYEITRWDPITDLHEICEAARLCYAASDLTEMDDITKFLERLRNDGHFTPFEHSILSVIFVTNRGVTHELVRHRLASYNQESTRYCNYSKNKFGNSVAFIRDTSLVDDNDKQEWLRDCELCEERYFARLNRGCTPDRARGVLNNDVRTKIKVTANYREWRHIFKLRCDNKKVHYQMAELLSPLLDEVKNGIPVVFDDIQY
jgi:thymidylate synthase (FAD)